jgi:Flp pilus assembly protein TadB
MNIGYVLTLCTALVAGGAFITGSADARSKSDEETSKKASASSDRSIEKAAKEDRKAALAVEKPSKKESASSDRYIDKSAKDFRTSDLAVASVSSVSAAVPEPSSLLLLLGSSLAGLAAWSVWRRKKGMA